MAPLLTVRALHKRYNAPVLVDFDFELHRGEVHALVGGNGAGKSTFARILAGLTRADAGEISLEGRRFAPASRRAAADAGIVMVMQELNVLPTLTVAENLFLDRLPRRWGWIDRTALHANARLALARVGLEALDPAGPAATLGIGHQQLLEIAAALAQECRMLILDEPTAALTARETDELFRRLDDLKQRGVGIVYVSHRMDEIRRIADRVTVLRDGRRVATRARGETETSELIELMTGGATAQARAERVSAARTNVALAVRGLRAGAAVREVDLTVRHGEVLGLAGLVGAGRTELLRAIFGATPRDAGEIRIDGRVVRIDDPADAVAVGIGLVPEDRKTQGLLLPRPVGHNASLGSLRRFARRGWIDEAAEDAAVAARFARLALKHDRLSQPVAELSGGNQQKAVLARWLLQDVNVLLLDEPTRGIDVAAKAVIYELLGELAAAGKAIVMVSSETPELMAVCDRIAVMSAGRIAAEFAPDDWSEEKINRAAFHGHVWRRP
jgi:ribose transport system ATP-binding protein